MTARPIIASALVVTAFLLGGCADPDEDDDGTADSAYSTSSGTSQDDEDEDDDILFEIFFGDDDDEDDSAPSEPRYHIAHSPPLVAMIGARNDTQEALRITFDGRAGAGDDRGDGDPDLPRVVVRPAETVTLRFYGYQMGYTLFAVNAAGTIVDVHVTDEGDWVIQDHE